MFSAFSQMLQQIFSMFTKLASAGEKLASGLDHLGGWTEDTAAAFSDQAKAERELKHAVLQHNLKQRRIKLAQTIGEVDVDAAPVPTPAPVLEAVPAAA